MPWWADKFTPDAVSVPASPCRPHERLVPNVANVASIGRRQRTESVRRSIKWSCHPGVGRLRCSDWLVGVPSGLLGWFYSASPCRPHYGAVPNGVSTQTSVVVSSSNALRRYWVHVATVAYIRRRQHTKPIILVIEGACHPWLARSLLWLADGRTVTELVGVLTYSSNTLKRFWIQVANVAYMGRWRHIKAISPFMEPASQSEWGCGACKVRRLIGAWAYFQCSDWLVHSRPLPYRPH